MGVCPPPPPPRARARVCVCVSMCMRAREISPRATCACACESFCPSRASGCRGEVWKGAQPSHPRRRRAAAAARCAYLQPLQPRPVSSPPRVCVEGHVVVRATRTQLEHSTPHVRAPPPPPVRSGPNAGQSQPRAPPPLPTRALITRASEQPSPPLSSATSRYGGAVRADLQPQPHNSPLPPPPPLPPSEGQALHVTASTPKL